jgi:hypothetical protein
MNLLFDTHAFIWWDSEPAKLSARVLTLCHDTTNVLFLSGRRAHGSVLVYIDLKTILTQVRPEAPLRSRWLNYRQGKVLCDNSEVRVFME